MAVSNVRTRTANRWLDEKIRFMVVVIFLGSLAVFEGHVVNHVNALTLAEGEGEGVDAGGDWKNRGG